MNVVMLPGDALFWLLTGLTALWAFRKRRDVYVRAMWRRIFRSPAVSASAVVLAAFFSIATLDAIHWRTHQGRIVSLLDTAMAHTIASSERTYSAPFAVREYTKSIVTQHGKPSQIYRPLRHVHPQGGLRDGLIGVLGGLAAVLLPIVWLYRRFGRDDAVAWRSAAATFALVGAFGGWVYAMSFHYHVLGTDKVGEDVLYMTLKSIRTGVLIGTLSTLVTLPFALALGMAAGYFRGLVDDIVQYLYTTLSSVPGVLLIAAAVLGMEVGLQAHPELFRSSLERADVRLVFLIVILGITGWTGLCRMVRAETMRIAKLDFVTAAQAFGVRPWRILRRHVLPNLAHIVIISVVLDFSSLVLAEAVLSYVGIGVDPTMYSWGNMINQARLEMARDPMVWWPLLAAFVSMFALVLAANIVADRIQYVLDPRNER